MSELRPPDSGAHSGTSGPAGDGPPTDHEDDALAAGTDEVASGPGSTESATGTEGSAAAPPVDVPPPPPASATADVPPPPAPPPPVDLAAAEDDAAPGTASSPPLPPPPAPPVDAGDGEVAEAEAGRRRPWLPVLIAVAVVAVAVGAFLVLGKDDDDTAAPGTSSTTVAGTEFTTVRDEEAAFTISYPESWVSLRPAQGEERLLLSAGGQNYFQLKVRTIDPGSVAEQIAEGLKDVRMVTEPRQFSLNGLETYYFLYYTPVTEESPTEGVHAHYFVMNGDKMYTMVFQALPTDGFTALAPTFDKVAESFEATPAPSASTTTAATPSTTSR